MPVQSEQILEEGLVKTLIENSYERVILNDVNLTLNCIINP